MLPDLLINMRIVSLKVTPVDVNQIQTIIKAYENN